jgi:alpha-methylacyl-CoA racemase
MGPLNGYTVIELAGIGPGPMGGMMLADMGADLIRIDRAGGMDPRLSEMVSGRGKKSVVLNLKDPEGVETFLRMVENADVVIDPFRPGVCEKLGIGPEVCLQRNPRVIFARMTGWGQDGPLAQAAGHDINYISITGALYAMGRAGGKPVPPLNLVGDMGGGGMLLVNGVLADGGAHFYDTYECADGEYISIGSIEKQFYALLKEKAGLSDEDFGEQNDRAQWPAMKEKLTAVFKQKSQAQWCELMEGSDVCFAPVLSFTDAPKHPANVARQTYIEIDGVTQPAPAPRFSRTASEVAHSTHGAGEDTDKVLAAMGFAEQDIQSLREKGAIA